MSTASGRVFISSTSEDLSDYREVAIATCNRLGLVPVGMEFFGAMGPGATDGSLRRINESDVYVGISAYRYGYIEPGFDRSVTEEEFNHAGERGLERLCFLTDPSHPWAVDAVDWRQMDEVQRFREMVERLTIRELFTTADDFRAKLLASLVDWQRRRGDAPDRAPVGAGLGVPLRLAPSPPGLVIGRERDVALIRDRIRVSGTVVAPRIVIRGWPGVGKTTLLATLAHDTELLERFPDPLLWASVGERSEPVTQLAEWAAALGGALEQPATLSEAMVYVRSLLERRRSLLIVDDVWEADAAQPLLVGGSGCATLISTRLPEVARTLVASGSDIHVLERLSDDDGLMMLSRLTPTVVDAHPEQARALVVDLEGLPLAIRVAGRLLERDAMAGLDVSDLFVSLGTEAALLAETAPEDRFDPRTGVTPTVDLLLRQSTERLDETARERFASLAAFAPKPATFELEALQAVWGLADARPVVRELVDRGLLEPIPSQGRYWLHAILVMHANSLLARL